MRATVHCRLDLHDFVHFQILFWWSLHHCINHPSIILSHPILCWSSLRVSSLLVCESSSPTHLVSWDMIADCTSVAVPLSFIHLSSFAMLRLHWVLMLSAGHCRIWILSSIAAWHWGHFTMDLWFLLTMFFPCAKWPVICLETHLLHPSVLLLIARYIAVVSKSFWIWLTDGIFSSNIAEQIGHSLPLWLLVGAVLWFSGC